MPWKLILDVCGSIVVPVFAGTFLICLHCGDGDIRFWRPTHWPTFLAVHFHGSGQIRFADITILNLAWETWKRFHVVGILKDETNFLSRRVFSAHEEIELLKLWNYPSTPSGKRRHERNFKYFP